VKCRFSERESIRLERIQSRQSFGRGVCLIEISGSGKSIAGAVGDCQIQAENIAFRASLPVFINVNLTVAPGRFGKSAAAAPSMYQQSRTR
jgi:hypothetical protein